MKLSFAAMLTASALCAATPSLARDYTFIGTINGGSVPLGSYVDGGFSIVDNNGVQDLTAFSVTTHYFDIATSSYFDHTFSIDDITFDNRYRTVVFIGKPGGVSLVRGTDDISMYFTPGGYVDNGSGSFTSSAAPGQDFVFYPHITSPVPEAGSWGMLIVGFGLTGAAMRKRRERTVRVQYNI